MNYNKLFPTDIAVVAEENLRTPAMSAGNLFSSKLYPEHQVRLKTGLVNGIDLVGQFVIPF